MKHISECMARDSEGGANKKKNLLSSNDISIFFFLTNLQLVLRASVN